MTKEQMAAGLALGRTLTQEDWAAPTEIQAVDELVDEGKAAVTPWAWRNGFQCQMRRVTGRAASE